MTIGETETQEAALYNQATTMRHCYPHTMFGLNEDPSSRRAPSRDLDPVSVFLAFCPPNLRRQGYTWARRMKQNLMLKKNTILPPNASYPWPNSRPRAFPPTPFPMPNIHLGASSREPCIMSFLSSSTCTSCLWLCRKS